MCEIIIEFHAIEVISNFLFWKEILCCVHYLNDTDQPPALLNLPPPATAVRGVREYERCKDQADAGTGVVLVA